MKSLNAEDFRFRWQNDLSLGAILKMPLRAVSMDRHGRFYIGTLTLWHTDGTWLNIDSRMIDFGERDEIGILCFNRNDAHPAKDYTVHFEPAPLEIERIYRLSVDINDQITADAGIALETRSRGLFPVLGGSFPLTLAVGGFFDMPRTFEPEYEIGAYRWSAMDIQGHSDP